ncbi:EamA family transporter [Brucella haematophila]|uniref:EamA family transporter n=1 Tax=Brucella haematophila TaxID=419474 RepID=A0ABX1DQL2_9HYPH|nr:EamA family transporter [Brucella haematophila]NKC05229.1 EamA family transporter [Brucella haematophila]TMV02502.1 transporter [Brucella haematophila]
MKSHVSLWIAIPVFNTLAQIFVKFAAEQLDQITTTGLGWAIAAATSPWMLAAVAVEIACFFFWMKVLADFDLSKAFPISAISYVAVLAASWFWFQEPTNLLQITGSVLILSGVWLVSTAEQVDAELSEPELK